MRGDFQITVGRTKGALVVQASSDRVFGRHWHEEYGLGVMEQGAHRSSSGRGQIEAAAGDVISVNPGEIHDGEPIGGRRRRWRMMYLEPALVTQAWAEASEGGRGEFEFRLPAGRDPQALPLVAELLRRQTSPEVGDRLRLEELFLALLARLGRQAPVTGRGGAAPGIGQAMALIDADPAGPLTLEALARAAGVSRFQTLRGFVRATGLTPHAYLVQRRLELARRLLQGGEAPAAAAAQAGFADQSHLNRNFTRAYGYTPGAYAGALQSRPRRDGASRRSCAGREARAWQGTRSGR